MTNPEILDRILENCTIRFRSVVCPKKEKVASITALRSLDENARWSVVECSLLRNGEVSCAMTCLRREREFDPQI